MALRRHVAVCIVLLFVAGAPMLLVAQNKKAEPKKLSKQEQADIQTLVKLTDAVSAGQQAPADLQVTWQQSHFLKAQDGKTFIPFTLDVKGLTSPGVALYVRAVKKVAAAAPVAAAEKGEKKDEKKVEYPWDDLQIFDVPADGRFSRALAVPAGDYDLYLAIKERSTGKKNEINKIAVIRRAITVPDFVMTPLATSSIILAEAVEPSPALDPESQRASPYTFGTMKVTPSLENKFKKTGELNILFWIYGVTPSAAQKPDVVVEYNFHQRLPDGEKYFNKTAPQPLNAQTLQPEFDLSVGHLLPGSQSLPLASFPPGDYRLEIKITDKPSGKSITQNVNFNVGA